MARMSSRDIIANGIRMRIADQGTGPALLFLHGLGWDSRLWAGAPARFADRYRVILGDTRGHGRSELPPGPYSIRQFAADWRAVLGGLGVARVCIVGLSQGGMIAQQIAVDAPDLIGALVLAGTSCRQDEATTANMAERLVKMRAAGPEAGARVAAEAIFSPGFKAANPGYLARFVTERAAQPQEPLIAAMSAGADYDVSGALPGLRKPVLVIAGSDDGLMPVPVVRTIADLIPGAEFTVVPGLGHIMPVEQPDTIYRLVEDFLARHYPPAGAAA